MIRPSQWERLSPDDPVCREILRQLGLGGEHGLEIRRVMGGPRFAVTLWCRHPHADMAGWLGGPGESLDSAIGMALGESLDSAIGMALGYCDHLHGTPSMPEETRNLTLAAIVTSACGLHGLRAADLHYDHLQDSTLWRRVLSNVERAMSRDDRPADGDAIMTIEGSLFGCWRSSETALWHARMVPAPKNTKIRNAEHPTVAKAIAEVVARHFADAEDARICYAPARYVRAIGDAMQAEGLRPQDGQQIYPSQPNYDWSFDASGPRWRLFTGEHELFVYEPTYRTDAPVRWEVFRHGEIVAQGVAATLEDGKRFAVEAWSREIHGVMLAAGQLRPAAQPRDLVAESAAHYRQQAATLAARLVDAEKEKGQLAQEAAALVTRLEDAKKMTKVAIEQAADMMARIDRLQQTTKRRFRLEPVARRKLEGSCAFATMRLRSLEDPSAFEFHQPAGEPPVYVIVTSQRSLESPDPIATADLDALPDNVRIINVVPGVEIEAYELVPAEPLDVVRRR